MILCIPTVLFNEIRKFLTLSELVLFENVSKKIPKIKIKYKTYQSKTIYKNIQTKTQTIETSYLLTNGKTQDKPTQIRDNYVEIKLYHGKILYYFIIYQNIYSPEKDILDYLKYADNKRIAKKIYHNNDFYQLSFCKVNL